MNAIVLPRLYTESEAADMLEISEATLRRIRRRRGIAYLLIGRKVRTPTP